MPRVSKTVMDRAAEWLQADAASRQTSTYRCLHCDGFSVQNMYLNGLSAVSKLLFGLVFESVSGHLRAYTSILWASQGCALASRTFKNGSPQRESSRSTAQVGGAGADRLERFSLFIVGGAENQHMEVFLQRTFILHSFLFSFLDSLTPSCLPPSIL